MKQFLRLAAVAALSFVPLAMMSSAPATAAPNETKFSLGHAVVDTAVAPALVEQANNVDLIVFNDLSAITIARFDTADTPVADNDQGHLDLASVASPTFTGGSNLSAINDQAMNDTIGVSPGQIDMTSATDHVTSLGLQQSSHPAGRIAAVNAPSSSPLAT